MLDGVVPLGTMSKNVSGPDSAWKVLLLPVTEKVSFSLPPTKSELLAATV